MRDWRGWLCQRPNACRPEHKPGICAMDSVTRRILVAFTAALLLVVAESRAEMDVAPIGRFRDASWYDESFIHTHMLVGLHDANFDWPDVRAFRVQVEAVYVAADLMGRYEGSSPFSLHRDKDATPLRQWLGQLFQQLLPKPPCWLTRRRGLPCICARAATTGSYMWSTARPKEACHERENSTLTGGGAMASWFPTENPECLFGRQEQTYCLRATGPLL